MLNEQAKQDILAAFGLSEDECEIKSATNGTLYTIKPKKNNENGNKKLPIKEIKNSMVFNQHNLSFENCVFECEIFLTYKTFNKALNFDRCVFKKFVNFNGTTFKKISFKNTIFEDIVYFIRIKIKQTSFLRSRFKERAFFSESTFKNKANFAEVIFDNNAYFDEAVFEKGANFDRSEFCRHAHFYGTRFNAFPNFTQTIFNGSINLTNVENAELNATIDSLKEKIEGIYEQRKKKYNENQDKNPEKNLQKHEIANELRDSFRAIRFALIKDNNMLDAHDYEVLEQYCKEIESEYKNSKQ